MFVFSDVVFQRGRPSIVAGWDVVQVSPLPFFFFFPQSQSMFPFEAYADRRSVNFR